MECMVQSGQWLGCCEWRRPRLSSGLSAGEEAFQAAAHTPPKDKKREKRGKLRKKEGEKREKKSSGLSAGEEAFKAAAAAHTTKR